MFVRSVTAIPAGLNLGIKKIVLNIQKNYSINSSAMATDRFKLPQRYEGQGDSVWNEYAALAAKFNPINLGQGFPNFEAPNIVKQALADVALDTNVLLHQYTRGFGHPRLINALSKLYGHLSGQKLDPLTQVLVTCGAYEALYCAICGHVDNGDEVIIIEPFFDCYEPMVLSAGGIPRYIALQPHGDSGKSGNWNLDEKELESLFNKKTKAIILNTPNNPLGKVFTRKELETIAKLCQKWDVLCIADEVYEWMVYPGHEHIRICTLPGMWDRTITIGSAGKTFSVTGWKTGWAYGPVKIMKNLYIVHQNCIYTHVTPIQEAVARCFEIALPHIGTSKCLLSEIVSTLQPKREIMAKFLRDVGMTPVIPDGGYFMMADWTPLSDKCDLSQHKDKYKDFKFTKWLTQNVGVQGIPPSAFYSTEHKHHGEDYIRLCFIKTDEVLHSVAGTLHKWKGSNL